MKITTSLPIHELVGDCVRIRGPLTSPDQPYVDTWFVVSMTRTSLTVRPVPMTRWERIKSWRWWVNWAIPTIRSWNPCNDATD